MQMLKTYQNFLIADDDPDDQELFMITLLEFNNLYNCATATNGLDALNQLCNPEVSLPDLIFLDLNMPKMNGKECLIEIKKIDTLSLIPVIIYSTSADKRQMQETLQLGASYYLQKPNQMDELSGALKRILSIDWANA
jgi:CheY-like chemotaxis protein